MAWNRAKSGVDNSAFVITEPYSFPFSTRTDDLWTNGIVLNHIGDNEQSNNFLINNYGSSGNSWSDQINFIPAYNIFANGSTVKSKRGTVREHYLRTYGRSSVPLTIRNKHPIGTVVKRTHSKNQLGVDTRNFISHLDIETDKVSGYLYRPGEEITGTIILLIRKSLEIRSLDIIVTGQGKLKVKKSSDRTSYKVKETYLHKEKCVIGDRGLRGRTTLAPGQYTSKFRVKLPADLPSTIHQEDKTNNYTFDINYNLRVRVCDDIDVMLSHHASTYNKSVRVLLEKQINFNIERGFDLNTIPDAMSPILHTEQVYLSCSHQKPATVSVRLDRSVFLAGDQMRLLMSISLPDSQSVKKINCKFQQTVITDKNRNEIACTLWKTMQRDPFSRVKKTTKDVKADKNTFEIAIPTDIKMLSPYSLGSSKVKVDYFITIDVKLTPAGGTLSFKIPVAIGPCADPIYGEKGVSNKVVPVFNRTIRFPFFSDKTPSGTPSPHRSTQIHASNVQVKTNYSNGFFARCLLCCI